MPDQPDLSGDDVRPDDETRPMAAVPPAPVENDHGVPEHHHEHGEHAAPSRRGFVLFRGRSLTRAHVLAAVLLGLLGFSLVVQARQTQTNALDSLSQTQLVQLLDDANNQADRLDIEARELQQTQRDLQSGTDRDAAAEKAARARLQVLGVLAGTVPASGPGIQLTVTDPTKQVTASILLDTVQELRDAGAEAIQLGNVRVVASTSLVDSGTGQITVDGQVLTPPYRFLAIGDPQTMAAALDIPGGVREVLRQVNADSTVDRSAQLTISALHQTSTPQYAVPQAT